MPTTETSFFLDDDREQPPQLPQDEAPGRPETAPLIVEKALYPR